MIAADDLEEILRVIGQTGHSWSGPWDHWTYKQNWEPFTVPGVGTIEVIDVHEVREGDWSGETWIVFKVTDLNGSTALFRKDGHYQSFDGTTWDHHDFREVREVKKYITAYE